MPDAKDDNAVSAEELDLKQVRAGIDTLDLVILNAIKDRADLAAQVSKAKGGRHTFRPGREADLIRNLVRQSSLPASLVEHIWRVIIAHNLASQAELNIAVHDDVDTVAAAQFRFGRNVAATLTADSSDVIASVAARTAHLGVIPHWQDDADWLSALASHRAAGDDVYIAAYTHMHDDHKLRQCVVIASVLPDASSADQTLIMGDDNLSLRDGHHPDALGLLGIVQICDIS